MGGGTDRFSSRNIFFQEYLYVLTALEDTIDLNGLKLKKSCDIKKKSDIL